MANNVELEYAQALFSIYYDDAVAKEVLNQLLVLRDVINSDLDISKFVSHPLISPEEKKKVITKAFKNCRILDFVCVLIDNNRLENLNGIIDQYEHFYYASKNIMPLEVVTASSLDEKVKQDIEKSLKKKFSKTVFVRYTVDKEIIGGAILKTSGQVLDNSYLGQLASLKDFLVN